MDDLKFPDWSEVPPQKNQRLSMDQYLEFVLFNRKNFPQGKNRFTPVPVRFVIREDGDEYSPKKP